MEGDIGDSGGLGSGDEGRHDPISALSQVRRIG
jgi:hypothetical protein